MVLDEVWRNETCVEHVWIGQEIGRWAVVRTGVGWEGQKVGDVR